MPPPALWQAEGRGTVLPDAQESPRLPGVSHGHEQRLLTPRVLGAQEAVGQPGNALLVGGRPEGRGGRESRGSRAAWGAIQQACCGGEFGSAGSLDSRLGAKLGCGSESVGHGEPSRTQHGKGATRPVVRSGSQGHLLLPGGLSCHAVTCCDPSYCHATHLGGIHARTVELSC